MNSLSFCFPASALEDASNDIKELEYRLKELEGSLGTKRKDVHESVISIKRCKNNGVDVEYFSSDGTNSEVSNALSKSSPVIEVMISGNSLLLKI